MKMSYVVAVCQISEKVNLLGLSPSLVDDGKCPEFPGYGFNYEIRILVVRAVRGYENNRGVAFVNPYSFHAFF